MNGDSIRTVEKKGKRYTIETYDAGSPTAAETQLQVREVYRITQMTLPEPASRMAMKYLSDKTWFKITYPVVAMLLSVLISSVLALAGVKLKGWYDIIFLGICVVVLDLLLRAVTLKTLFKYGTKAYANIVKHALEADFAPANFNASNDPKQGNYCFVVRDPDTGVVVASVCLRAKEGETNYDKTRKQRTGECLLTRVGTLPSHQRQGLARMIVKHAMDIAKRDRKCNHMWLQTSSPQEAACALYEAMGFKLTANQVIEFGVSVKTYELDL